MTEWIRAARAVTPDGVVEGVRIGVEGGLIVAVEAGAPPDDGLWALPGFVDTHTHGALGHDYGTATRDEARAILAFQRSRGTTTAYASLATRALDDLCGQLGVLAGLVEAGELAGIHLEGPFLAPERRGAHRADLLRTPDPDVVRSLLEAGRGSVRMVTLAPELPGADEAVSTLRAAGVRVAFGHSDADALGCARMVEHGARVATHLFNAMRPIHHRDPGPVPGLLTDPRVAVELICDGVHLHADTIDLAIAVAGPDRVVLVTDAMAATGLGDGDYPLGDLTARVIDGTARVLGADGRLGAIAGSTLTMDVAVKNLVSAGHPPASVARMAAATPAGVHGLDDVGALEVGRRADVVLIDERGALQRVFHAGAEVSRPR
ncbi:N-acetylglucosamine-6-phosphate deacetylase [Mariniluteicoccus endophyticus]